MGRRALISVYDKKGLLPFVRRLLPLGFEILSSGGTGKVLREGGIPSLDVSEVTSFPELLGGRLKTLHPLLHGGILARRDSPSDLEETGRLGVPLIDLVVVNFYPFEEAVSEGRPLEEILETIDVGGPALVRAAAKNFLHVTVVTHPDQYDEVASAFEKGGPDRALRERLAWEAFARTARYDTLIDQFFRRHLLKEDFPKILTLTFTKIQDLRYGENSHQRAAFYSGKPTKEPCVVNARKLHGKELSYNNIVDADIALEAVKDFERPTCVIIKHATPSGIASAETIRRAWELAFACDTYSPYGGVVAFNRRLDRSAAEALSEIFLEVVLAPEYDSEALEILTKKKNLRILAVPNLDRRMKWGGLQFKSVVGGLVVQDRDILEPETSRWKVVTQREPTAEEMRSMIFAFKAVRHVRSNSVVFVQEEHTVAIGGGQTSRVDATRIAVLKGGERIRGSVMASDAFFPFRDGVDEAARAGVRAIVQPGGSIRDAEVIQAANEHGISMVFTGQRCFRH